MTDWQPIETAPTANPIIIRTESGFECMAEFFKWGCTGMCVPPGQTVHTAHMHSAWVMVDQDGDQLFSLCGDMAVVDPTEWRLP